MLASVLIILVCLFLLVYWFRYTCLLLLSTAEQAERATQVARANRLSFRDVQQKLEDRAAALDALHRALERDYRILEFLLEHSEPNVRSLEQRLLKLDYRLMHVYYRLMRNSSADRSRAALSEMSRILTCFAQKMGERAAHYA